MIVIDKKATIEEHPMNKFITIVCIVLLLSVHYQDACSLKGKNEEWESELILLLRDSIHNWSIKKMTTMKKEIHELKRTNKFGCV